jgi:hypothetical protein
MLMLHYYFKDSYWWKIFPKKNCQITSSSNYARTHFSCSTKTVFFRNSDKAELASITTNAKYFPGNKDIMEDNKQYIFDGGALLQKLPW